MRRSVKNRNHVSPDYAYQSEKVGKFINYVMWHGKKTVARNNVYKAFSLIAEKEEVDNPLEVFELALKNSGPRMEVRSKRVGGANYQIPMEVRPERRQMLSMNWIIEAARKGQGSSFPKKLADEIILAKNEEGEAVKRRDMAHKMAEANKAFAHFAW